MGHDFGKLSKRSALNFRFLTLIPPGQFFISVVPACAAFIGFSCWEATRFTEVLTHPHL